MGLSPTEDIGPKGAALWEEFQERADWDLSDPDADSNQTVNEDSGEEYTVVFQCHASVYVFADRYDIKELRDLATRKLRHILARFTLYPERTYDIIALVRYTYANTVDCDEQIDKLRKVILDYVVCHVERLVKNSGF